MVEKPVSLENRQPNLQLGKIVDTNRARAEISRPNLKRVTRTGINFKIKTLEKIDD